MKTKIKKVKNLKSIFDDIENASVICTGGPIGDFYSKNPTKEQKDEITKRFKKALMVEPIKGDK